MNDLRRRARLDCIFGKWNVIQHSLGAAVPFDLDIVMMALGIPLL